MYSMDLVFGNGLTTIGIHSSSNEINTLTSYIISCPTIVSPYVSDGSLDGEV